MQYWSPLVDRKKIGSKQGLCCWGSDEASIYFTNFYFGCAWKPDDFVVYPLLSLITVPDDSNGK